MSREEVRQLESPGATRSQPPVRGLFGSLKLTLKHTDSHDGWWADW